MKSKYWSCSKFADWLRGTSKPYAGTTEMWNDWDKTAKLKKFRYWLAEKGLDYLQDFFCWPKKRINDICFYINNRWVTKSHALISNLKRGQWYDLDTRLLHATFDELVNFVEIELAWMFVAFSKEECKKYKTPWWRTVFRIGRWRSSEAGVAYLNWAAELKIDEEWVDKHNASFGQPTSQAIAAQEIIALYNWWKKERPNRIDPSDASGWNDYYEKNLKAGEVCSDDSGLGSFITNKTHEEDSRKILDICFRLEKEQEDEDTTMLIRLIKIRQHLWT